MSDRIIDFPDGFTTATSPVVAGAEEILEYANLAAFPVTGDGQKIYLALDTNILYHWTGAVYVALSGNVIDADKGDVTVSSSGSVWTIDNNTISNAKLSDVPTQTIKGRTTAGSGDPEDLTATQATAILNVFGPDSGSGGVKGLAPATVSGDATKFLKGDGTWSTVVGVTDADKGDITVTGSGATWTIDPGVVSNSKLSDVTGPTFKGKVSGTGSPEDLTSTQATTIINTMQGDSGAGGVKGLAPAQAIGDAAKFLRGDATWQTVATSTAWGGITGTLSSQLDLQTELDLKAPLLSPALTGSPTAPTQSLSDDSTKLATTAFARSLPDSAPNFMALDSSWTATTKDNKDAQGSIGAWISYADAAASIPVDMTGGSPNITLSRTTTAGEILNGNASFKVVKSAANRQGEGVSCTFNVPPAYQGKLCQIKIPYKVASGTVTDGDILCFIYDVTNSVLITPLANSLNQASGTINAYFTSSPSAGTPANQNYRVGLHFASTGATAQTFVFDDVNVGPVDSVYGPNVTAWQSYTPTFAGIGTPTNVNAYWRQAGDFVEVQYVATTGTVSATTFSISLPNGYVSSASYSATINTLVGSNARAVVGANNSQCLIVAPNSTGVNFSLYTNASVNPLVAQLGNALLNTSESISGFFSVKVDALSASTPAIIINPNIGPWQTFIPTFTGFGTVSTQSVRWRQVGESVEIEGRFTTGTPTATEARISLPNNYTSKSDYATLEVSGDGAITGSTVNIITLIEPSVQYITFGTAYDTVAGLVKRDGNTTVGATSGMSFMASVRVNGLSAAGVINTPTPAYIREEQAANTSGGTFTSGSYATRTLNTSSLGNTGITLSSNQMVIPPGTWRIDASAPAFTVGRHKAKLRNVTDSTDTLIGSSEFTEATASDRSNTRSIVQGVFTITSQKTFEIQHRCETTVATRGFGVEANFGDVEVYTQVTLIKVSN